MEVSRGCPGHVDPFGDVAELIENIAMGCDE